MCLIVGHTSCFACKIRLLGCIVCFARPVAVAQRERRGEKVSASGVRLRKFASNGNLMRPRSHHILQSTLSDRLTSGPLASPTQRRQEFTQLFLACLMMYLYSTALQTRLLFRPHVRPSNGSYCDHHTGIFSILLFVTRSGFARNQQVSHFGTSIPYRLVSSHSTFGVRHRFHIRSHRSPLCDLTSAVHTSGSTSQSHPHPQLTRKSANPPSLDRIAN